jgi:GT2 family glycosyltransferase
MTATPDISAVILNYRRPDLLRRCLRSVVDAQHAADCSVEIVVVDDGSEDDSCDIVRREFPAVRLVAIRKNGGYPHAANTGIAAARGRWILTLNNDTYVEPSVFDELLVVAQSDPDVGLVAAQQRFASEPSVIYSAGMTIDRRGQASDRLMGRSIGESENEPVEVFGACGAAAIYSRHVLNDLGGFDERFAFGLEDADVSWRARMRGWRCLYAPLAVVYHDVGGTIPHGSDLRFFQAGRNRLLLLAKNLDTRELILYGPQIALFDLLYVAYAAVRLRTLAPLRGRLAGIRMWRTMRAAGAPGRVRVELAPAVPFRSVLARRRTWRLASGDVVEAASHVAWRK